MCASPTKSGNNEICDIIFHDPPEGDGREVVPFCENEDLAGFARTYFEFRGTKVVTNRTTSKVLEPARPPAHISKGFRLALRLIAITVVSHIVFRFAFGIGYSFCAVVSCLCLVIGVRHTATTHLN